MKTLFTLISLLFFSFTNAQLVETSNYNEKITTVGGFASGQMSHAAIKSETVDGTKVYTLVYGLSNAKSNQISFKETGNDLEELYMLLNSFFTKENKRNENYKKTFKLGDEEVICQSFQGIPIQIYFKTNQGEFYMSEKQLNKLFGKK